MSNLESTYLRSGVVGDLRKEVERLKLAERTGLNLSGPHTGGVKRTREYSSWKAMWDRCTLKTHVAYHRYGGAGITVCDRWQSFAAFIEDMGLRPHGKSLDRIKGNLGYFKENCRWDTRKNQARNTKAVIPCTVGGIDFGSIAEAAEYWEIKRKTLEKRIRHYGVPPQYWHLPKLPLLRDRA